MTLHYGKHQQSTNTLCNNISIFVIEEMFINIKLSFKSDSHYVTVGLKNGGKQPQPQKTNLIPS